MHPRLGSGRRQTHALPKRNMKVLSLGTTVTLLFLLLALDLPVHAQTGVTIQGRVTSEEGQPLEGAQVVVQEEQTGQRRGTITAGNGSYTVVGLPPGDYRISAQMIGHTTQSREVRLVVGQRATLDFRLVSGAIEVAGVTVESQREPTFEVQRTDVSTPVVQAEITNLPLNTRNTLNLAAIVPGIKTYAPTAGRSLPAGGAAPALRYYNFYLDGVEWKSMFNGNLVGIPQTGSPIPQEALREFRVHLNPYDAQYTRGGAYIISAVTHRGTNELEGSGFMYFQNNQLTTLDEFQRRSAASNPDYSRANYDRQQLGFNVRGPITRDKLFFSASYELNNTTNAIQVVPGQPSFNPRIWDEFAGTFSAPTKNHTGVLRMTASPTNRHTIDAIWAGRYYDSETYFGGSAAHSAGISAKYTIHSGQLRHTYQPSASISNQLSFNILTWSHNEAPLSEDPARIYPSIFFGRGGFPLELSERHLRLIDKITYTVPGGRHVLDGGVEISQVNTNTFLPANQRGVFQFATDTSSLPFRGTIGVGFFNPGSTEDARATTDGWVVGGFIQDRWQATDALTLNFGLRYDAELNTLNNDFEVPWASDPELQAHPALQGFLNRADRKNDLDNISPRFSFTWDVLGTSQTFLRGGYGLMYGRFPTAYAFFEKQNSAWRSYEFNNPGTTDPAELRRMVEEGGGTSRPSMTLVNTEIEMPEIHQYSIGVGHHVTSRLAINADYINSRGNRLYASRVLRGVSPNYGAITLWDHIGNSQFHAVTAGATFDRTVDEQRPLRLNAAYTLGWYRSEFEGLGGYADAAFFDMQSTTGDERHRLVLSGMAPLPAGFQISGVAIVASPTPYGVNLGQDVNGTGTFADDWPNGIRTQRPENSWENMYRTLDLRLSKLLPVGNGRFELVGEVFNAFNWTNWSNFSGRMRDAAGNPLDNFGQPSGVYAPRQAQVGLRYEF